MPPRTESLHETAPGAVVEGSVRNPLATVMLATAAIAAFSPNSAEAATTQTPDRLQTPSGEVQGSLPQSQEITSSQPQASASAAETSVDTSNVSATRAGAVSITPEGIARGIREVITRDERKNYSLNHRGRRLSMRLISLTGSAYNIKNIKPKGWKTAEENGLLDSTLSSTDDYRKGRGSEERIGYEGHIEQSEGETPKQPGKYANDLEQLTNKLETAAGLNNTSATNPKLVRAKLSGNNQRWTASAKYGKPTSNTIVVASADNKGGQGRWSLKKREGLVYSARYYSSGALKALRVTQEKPQR